MYEKDIEILRNAENDQERNWLLTKLYLDKLPPELADVVLRVAVPHWFNVPIFEAILQVDTVTAESMIQRIFDLPFTETFGSLGYTLHDLTRTAILTHLVSVKSSIFEETAKRASDYFYQNDDTQYQTEFVYQYLSTHPIDGLGLFRRQEAHFREKHEFGAAEHLIRSVNELVDIGVITDQELITELDRQKFLVGSKRIELIKKNNKLEDADSHIREIFKAFGKIYLGNNEDLAILDNSEQFEREFLQQKINEANLKGDLLSQVMWQTELGKVFFGEGDYSQALIEFNAALTLNGNYTPGLASRGKIYRRMGNFEAALGDFNRAIELDDKDDFNFAHRAETYRKMGNLELALSDFNRAIEINENNDWAIGYRGLTHFNLKTYELALLDFNRAIELDENNDWNFAHRGLIYQAMGNYELAFIDFNRAIDINDNIEMAIAYRGEAHSQMGNYKMALTDFNRSIEIKDNNGWVFAYRGATHFRMRNYKLALLDFNRSIEIKDNYEWGIAWRGKTYLQMGNYELALADFNRVIELGDKDEWNYANRGETLRKMKNYELALADFNRAIELDNNYEWAIALRGDTYRQMGNYESALSDFNNVIQLDKKDTWTMLRRALVLLRIRKYIPALIDLGKVIFIGYIEGFEVSFKFLKQWAKRTMAKLKQKNR